MKKVFLLLFFGIFLISFATATINIDLNSPSDGSTIYDNPVTFNASANTTEGYLVNMSLCSNITGSWGCGDATNYTPSYYELIDNEFYTGTTPSTDYTTLHTYNTLGYILSKARLDMYHTDNNVEISFRLRFNYSDGTSVYSNEEPTLNYAAGGGPASRLNYEFTPTDYYEKTMNSVEVQVRTSNPSYLQSYRVEDLNVYRSEDYPPTQTWSKTIPAGSTLWNVQACINDGSCAFADSNYTINGDATAPTITINSPNNIENYGAIDSSETLNVTITDTNLANCWYNYNGTNITFSCTSGVSTTESFILEDENLEITVYANDSLGNLGSSTREWEYLLLERPQTFTSPILESTQEVIILSLGTSDGFSVGQGTLIYNGTEYSSTKTEITDTTFNLTSSFIVPAGIQGFESENRTFYWNVSIINETSGTTTYITTSTNNQIVNELRFGLCGGDLDVPLLNFTLYDETTAEEINGTENATTFQATFNLGSNYDNLIKNYSINNISVTDSEFDFCTANYTSPIYGDLELFYTASGYADKNYYLTNSTLTNTTSEINLYLIPSASAIEFFISVEQNLDPLTSAKVNVRKYFVGEGIYRTVEIDETSSDAGEFTAYLELDKKYNFIISKNGVVLGTVTKTASCDEAPCTLTLSLESDVDTSFYTQFEDYFAQNVLYNLTWNPNTKIVTFDFIDTTGLANYFRMKIWKIDYETDRSLIIDSILYTSSGIITGNLSNYTSGDFEVKVYVSRSPETLVDFIEISIGELAGTFGTLGLFVALLIILTIVFGISFSPEMLVLTIPLAFIFLKLIGILSISWTGIVIICFLALIALVAMSRR